MKTAISIPDPLAQATDQLAERLGLSRSGLIQLAVKRLIEAYDEDEVTARLNAVYGGEPEIEVDPVLQSLQAGTLAAEEWE